LAIAVTVSVCPGCGANLDGDTGPPLRRPALWTLFDIRPALDSGSPIAVAPTYPQGIDPNEVLALQDDGTATLQVIPAFSEGQPAAYVLPELWVDFDRVWAQPWYTLLTAWDAKSPSQNRVKNMDGTNAPPVFDVGPDSLFYSPLWLNDYVVIPEGADPTTYTSADQFFDQNLPVYQGPAWTYSVRPDDVKLSASPVVHPYLQTPVASFLTEYPVSWVDGKSMGYFNEGSNNFKFDDALVVEEVPLFELAVRGADGNPQSLHAPRVMGSGPLFARRPADAPGGRPRFGAYSRITFAVTSASAAAFDPETYPDAAALLAAATPPIDPQAYRGRVATDAACFAKPEFPAGCTWLDSQARIEDAVGAGGVVPTEVTACSPLVFYGGKGIGR
jgi:hypothetical protein